MSRTKGPRPLQDQAPKSLRRHRIRHRQPIEPNATLSDEDAHGLLERSIGMALAAAGFECAQPAALQSFRVQTEEYMLHLLAVVAASMQSSRRTTPIPPDFAFMLAHQGLALSDLAPYFTLPSVPAAVSQPELAKSQAQTELPTVPLSPMLGPVLSGRGEKTGRVFIPPGFPSFPSKHTYQFTPDVRQVESDPRLVRERARLQGRLGEEALRRLMGAGAGAGAGAGGARGKKRNRDEVEVEDEGAGDERGGEAAGSGHDGLIITTGEEEAAMVAAANEGRAPRKKRITAAASSTSSPSSSTRHAVPIGSLSTNAAKRQRLESAWLESMAVVVADEPVGGIVDAPHRGPRRSMPISGDGDGSPRITTKELRSLLARPVNCEKRFWMKTGPLYTAPAPAPVEPKASEPRRDPDQGDPTARHSGLPDRAGIDVAVGTDALVGNDASTAAVARNPGETGTAAPEGNKDGGGDTELQKKTKPQARGGS
ncbi:MAG: hypothetical protein M1826_003688 [Phylliscum demangeonii]|nr:MAG: hypothetical protein M1826_003688 [Phylliscum demangeonii]